MHGVMKLIAFNGSPRSGWNTHTLLENVMAGAKSKGAGVELIHLYKLDYKGCRSCFACKRKNVTVGQCVIKDGLLPVLRSVRKCDAVVLGSPIYLGCVTGEMRSFMERLLYPYKSYDGKPSTFPRKIKSAIIYTMNISEAELPAYGYQGFMKANERYLTEVFGNVESMLVTETQQFWDYDKYAASRFDGEARKRRRNTVFREDCAKAFELGTRLVAG
jgi:multimeric flavodoxin WrbA